VQQPIRFTGTQRWVLALAAAGLFVAALDTMVVTTAIETLRHDLQASVTALEWTVNAYTLAFAACLMTGAALGDRFGHRRTYIAGLLLFAASSAACALAPNIAWLITGRLVQGMAAALVTPLAMTLIGMAFPDAQRGKALGISGGVTGLAVLSGPVVGGALVHGLGWQWIFWINLPVALMAAWLVRAKVPESRTAANPLDVRGAALMAASMLGLVWGLVRVNHAGWGSVEVQASLGAGAILGLAFLLSQRLRGADAMVPPRLFRAPVLTAGLAVAMLLTASLFGALFFMAQYFQVARGLSPLAAGANMLPWTATLFVVAPIAGAMVRRFGERPLVVSGLTLQAVGLVWLAAVAHGEPSGATWTLPLVLAGGGLSMATPAALSAVLGAVEPADIGKASGLYNTLRQLGGVVGVAVTVTVFLSYGGYGNVHEFTAGFAAVLATCALFSLAGAAAGLCLRARPRVATAATDERVKA
jgi:EmrB/QacA subfamily drug resistance transporter